MEAVRRWRADWRYPTTLLCLYGLFSMIKPLEPFLTPYLTGPDKNLTAEQVNNNIFPVWTYSYISLLVPVFVLTDWLRYKPVLVIQGIFLFISTATLLWTKSVPAMQSMQATYGLVTACDVAYFSYIYSMVDAKWYLKATSYSHSIQLLGNTLGSVLAQLLVSFHLASYHDLGVVNLAFSVATLLTSCLLPMPRQSMYFHHRKSNTGQKTQTHDGSQGHVCVVDGAAEPRRGPEESQREMRAEKLEKRGEKEDTEGRGVDEELPSKAGGPEETSVGAETCGKVLLQLRRDFVQCYSSRQMVYWSVWWAMATCGYNQTINYVQVLWEHVEPTQNVTIYNGGVEAVSNLLSAAAAYGIGFTEVRWDQWGELALGGFSGLGAAALFLMAFVSNIWVCYASYIVFKCLYMLLITIAMYQIAANLSMERYALVFGTNTFGALTLQTIITAVVVDKGGLGLGIVPQFIITASYFAVISLVFSLRGLYTVWRAQRSSKVHPFPVQTRSPDPP